MLFKWLELDKGGPCVGQGEMWLTQSRSFLALKNKSSLFNLRSQTGLNLAIKVKRSYFFILWKALGAPQFSLTVAHLKNKK